VARAPARSRRGREGLTMVSTSAPARLAMGVVLGAALAACGSARVHIDTGAPLSDADLAMRWSHADNRSADDFSEQLVVRGLLADGGSFYAKLTVTNLASADGRADLAVNVDLPDKRKLRFKVRKERDDWTWDKDRFRAEVGDGAIEVGVGRARVVCKNDDFELEASVSSALPPLRPAGGVVDKAAGWYVTTLPIPRGHIVVKLRVFNMPEAPAPEDGEPEPATEEPRPAPEAPKPDAPGPEPEAPSPTLDNPSVEATSHAEDTSEPAPEGDGDDEAADGPIELELEGVAYAEHRASTIPPYALAHRWHGIVDLDEDKTVVFSAFEHAHVKEARDKEPVVQGWFFAADDEGLLLYEPALRIWGKEWGSDDKTGYAIPGLVFVSDPQRAAFEGVVKLGSLSERKDDLASLKKLERLVVRRFMKPWTFRYDRARYLFRKQAPGQSMVEVRGEARYQYQQLNE